ncbi:hypothetical protein GPALN_004922 [Globodera pallida]|nr:hypothetical protein GPALN_004922 [Globodera pallida]
MCALIHRFGDEPLHKLLELIGEAGRIDVLISVRHFATNPMATECRHWPARMDSALISASDSISSSTAFARSVSAIDVHQQQRFILILHHENAKNRDLKKFHRLLIKNLEIYAKEEGIKVVDVDQCMCDQDLLGSVSRHFDRADQVVMELSPDYADLINAAEGTSSLTDQMVVNDQQQIDQRVRMKLYLHQMTFNEVLLNGNQNRRFRVVLMQGCRPEHIPRGWPGNTLHYRFPQDFEALMKKSSNNFGFQTAGNKFDQLHLTAGLPNPNIFLHTTVIGEQPLAQPSSQQQQQFVNNGSVGQFDGSARVDGADEADKRGHGNESAGRLSFHSTCNEIQKRDGKEKKRKRTKSKLANE